MSIFPTDLSGWISLIIAMGGGGLAVYYGLNNSRKAAVKENGDLAEKIKDNYKERVEQLEEKTKEQFTLIGKLEDRVKDLEITNRVLAETLGGAGEEATRFRKEGFEAMKGLAVLKENDKAILENMNKLFSLIEKHLDNESQLIKKLQVPTPQV